MKSLAPIPPASLTAYSPARRDTSEPSVATSTDRPSQAPVCARWRTAAFEAGCGSGVTRIGPLVSPSTRSSTFPTITRPARPRTFEPKLRRIGFCASAWTSRMARGTSPTSGRTRGRWPTTSSISSARAASAGLRVVRAGVAHPDQFDLDAECPPEARAEQPRPLRGLEGAVADEYALRRPRLLSLAHDQDRARRAVGESRGDAAHHQATEPPHPPAADDHESRADLLRLFDDRLDRPPLPEVLPGDRPALLLYPPYLRLEPLTPGVFQTAPYDVVEVGRGDGAPDVYHVQLSPASLREIDRSPGGEGRALQPVTRQQYLLRKAVQGETPLPTSFRLRALYPVSRASQPLPG